MEIYNVLKKVDQKLAASSEHDLAKQKFDFEMGELALTCVRNKSKISLSNNSESNKYANFDLSSIKDKILSSVNSIGSTVENTPGAKTLGYGLGGAAIGSLLGSNLTADKSETETEEQYKKRKTESAITGGIAGSAIGASSPSVLNAIKSLSGLGEKSQEGVGTKIIDSAVGSVINPTTLAVGAGAAGGGALNKFLSFLDKDQIAALAAKIEGNPKQDAYFIDQINKLKGMTPLIEKIKINPVTVPFRPNMIQKVGPLLNKILAHSSRGKMLLAGGAAAGLLGKKLLDTSAFNESAFE